MKTAKVFLGLGTNLGDKEANLNLAILHLKAYDIKIIQSSRIYVSPPWGFDSKDEFYNVVLEVETKLNPFQLLIEIKGIELKMGRLVKTSQNYESRIIDIDIIDYNFEIINYEDLIIPHPHLTKRNFVILPLVEICPNYIHPVFKTLLKDAIDEKMKNNIKFINKVRLLSSCEK